MMANFIMKALVVVAFVGALDTQARAQEVRKIGVFDFPPFYEETYSGSASGFLVDFATETFQKIGSKPVYQFYHVPQLIDALIAGDADLAMLTKHPLLDGKVLYSKEPISHINLVVYRGKNTPPVQYIGDLAGRSVLTLNGYGYGGARKQIDALLPPVRNIEASDIISGMDMLLGGRADYFLTYKRPSQEIANRKGYLEKEPWLVSDPIRTFDVYWVVSKKAEDAQTLLQQLTQ